MDKTRQHSEKERLSSRSSVNNKTGAVVNDGKTNMQNCEQCESRNENRRKGLLKQEDKRILRQKKIDKKRKVQLLHLKLENFDGNENELKNMLAKITRNAFTLRNFELENQNAFCIAEYPSARQVKDALYSFQTYNKTSRVKIIGRKQEFTRQLSSETKLSQYLDKIAEEAKIVLSKHQEQMNSLQDKIDRTGNPIKTFISVEKYEMKKEEMKTLKFKLEEMDKQKKEFKGLLKCTVDRLEEVRTKKKIDTALKEIYTAFHVECIRLKNALPMYAYRTEIISMVTQNQVSILLGETGSGKSTQVAQYMYQAGMANKGMIVCTQPRKIAAISLATRVAQEMCTSVGHLVGYKVGMQVKKSHDTKIIYMTDHMLLNECLQDKHLLSYSCIIIDEAHERSIYTDLLLGMVKKCMNNRPDLRVVVTSATIDPSIFVAYFGENCPVLSVAGRMFPVDVEWLDDENENENYEQAALEKTLEIHRTEEKGDILTFLTSPLEVERCCTAFRDALESETNFVCLPLHGRLQANEQQKVFDPLPKGKRKIVFATNSAETSITIPGIKFVVDTGVAKEMQFDPKRNISTLCVTSVTKSSADQRKGRAGRTEEGKCFRLYSPQVYEEMEGNSRPEILRVHLGHALLKLMELGVAPLEFDFVQAPPRTLMDAAMETLESIGAVANKLITELGKWIAKLPIDPTFGAFIFQAIKNGVGIESMILSACCATGGSIFYRSGTDEEKSKADKLKVRFCHEGGDLMTMLNVYREWHVQSEKLKGKWCAENAINGKAVKGVRETVNEILNVLKNEQATKLKFQLSSPTEIDIKLQKMLFRTFSRNICHYLGHEKAGYLVVQKDQQVQLFPASSLKSLGLQPDWLVMEQVLKTSRDFAINVTTVSNEWITEACSEGWLQLDLEKISRQRVEQAAVFEVGEQVYKDFVGMRHSELRKLEEALKLNNKNKIVILEASKQYGEISVYSQQNHELGIANTIGDRITSIRQKMKQETNEQFLSSSNSGVRVVIGTGLNVVDVLMADEYKTIFVSGIPKFIETKTEMDMCNIFEKFGKIIKIEQFRKSKNKNNWGRITFQKKEDAEQAVRMMKGNLDVSARPSIGFRSADIHSFRTKLQWSRRPSRGFGFVRFVNQSDAIKSYTFPIFVGGTVVKIKRSKSHMSEVHVGNLNPHVDEDVLRQGFEDALGLIPSDIERVTVIRQKVNTTPDILQTFRQRIQRKLQEYIGEGTYELDLRSPKDQDFTYLAFVSFSKPEEGLAACAGIDHSFVLNGEVVTMKADLKSSVMIPKLVYEKYKCEVNTLVETLSKSERAHIRQKELRNENVVVEVHTDSIETMIKVKTDILSAIKGSVMDVDTNADINKLFTWDGRKLINVVMDKTETTIQTDERLLSLSIHGSERNKQRAIVMLTEYLNELKNGKSTRLALKGADKPPGVMKELMLRYEFDLNKLKMETGLKCVELDHRFHVVTVLGDTQSTENCCSIIEKVIEYVIEKQNRRILKPTMPRDCAVCLCAIEEGDLYRLEVCGHAYCKECVELQFKSGTKSNTFPLSCSHDGCNELWSWKDITTLSVKSGVPVAVLVKKSTNLFVLQNKNSYRYCPTVNCPLIYRLSEKEKLFCCSECEVRICTACHNQFHDGLTCKMVESMKKDDGGLKLWMTQNAEKAKYCPKCKTAIEKIEGCNHMTCIGCKAHICWVCLAYFSSGSECYGHMNRVHGSFV